MSKAHFTFKFFFFQQVSINYYNLSIKLACQDVPSIQPKYSNTPRIISSATTRQTGKGKKINLLIMQTFINKNNKNTKNINNN